MAIKTIDIEVDKFVPITPAFAPKGDKFTVTNNSSVPVAIVWANAGAVPPTIDVIASINVNPFCSFVVSIADTTPIAQIFVISLNEYPTAIVVADLT